MVKSEPLCKVKSLALLTFFDLASSGSKVLEERCIFHSGFLRARRFLKGDRIPPKRFEG